MMTQKEFLIVLNRYRQLAEGWNENSWGEDPQDLKRFVEHLIVDVISLEDSVWMNMFVAGMIVKYLEDMKPSERFEPHLSCAKDIAKYLLVFMPFDNTGIRPDLFSLVRNNDLAFYIKNFADVNTLTQKDWRINK